MRFRKCVIAFQFPGSPLYVHVPSTFCSRYAQLRNAVSTSGSIPRTRVLRITVYTVDAFEGLFTEP